MNAPAAIAASAAVDVPINLFFVTISVSLFVLAVHQAATLLQLRAAAVSHRTIHTLHYRDAKGELASSVRVACTCCVVQAVNVVDAAVACRCRRWRNEAKDARRDSRDGGC